MTQEGCNEWFWGEVRRDEKNPSPRRIFLIACERPLGGRRPASRLFLIASRLKKRRLAKGVRRKLLC